MVVPPLLVAAEKASDQSHRQVENDFQIGAGFIGAVLRPASLPASTRTLLGCCETRPDCAAFPSRRSGQNDIGIVCCRIVKKIYMHIELQCQLSQRPLDQRAQPGSCCRIALTPALDRGPVGNRPVERRMLNVAGVAGWSQRMVGQSFVGLPRR